MATKISEIRLQAIPGVIGRVLTIRFSDGTEMMLQVESEPDYPLVAIQHLINTKLNSVEKLHLEK